MSTKKKSLIKKKLINFYTAAYLLHFYVLIFFSFRTNTHNQQISTKLSLHTEMKKETVLQRGQDQVSLNPPLVLLQ